MFWLYNQWGKTQLAVESPDEALLPAFASRRAAGSLAIMVINKDPSRARSVELAFEGFRPAGQAEIWLQDAARPTGEKLGTATFGDTLSYAIPPYSVALFVVQAAQLPVWPLWVGLLLGVAWAFALILEREERRACEELTRGR